MDAHFKDAATAQKTPRLTFVCDWQKTLGDIRWSNYELLQFISDAKKAGHRVIVTSSDDMEQISDLLEMFIETAQDKGYDILDLDQFELIRKQHLKALKFKADYVMDDQLIDAQLVSDYVEAGQHIRVYPDFSTSPLSLDQLRTICDVPRSKDGGTPSASAPAPVLA